MDLLCDLLAQRAKVSADHYQQYPECEPLERAGFVREQGIVRSLVCLECDTVHDAEIVHEGAQYGYFCPDLGFVQVERDKIRGLQTSLPEIIAGLAEAFDCNRRKTTPLQGATWRIGTVATEGGDITLYFHPCMIGAEDAADLTAALMRDIRTTYRVILTAAGTLQIPDAETALLSDAVEFDAKLLGFSASVDPRDIVQAPRKRQGGRPNRFKETLVPLIQSRIEDGSALSGRNEEAKAILAILQAQNSEADTPSLSSIKDYVTQYSTGQ